MAEIELKHPDLLDARKKISGMPSYQSLAVEPGSPNFPLHIEQDRIIPDLLITRYKVFHDERGNTKAPIVLDPVRVVLGRDLGNLSIEQMTRSDNEKTGTGRGLHCAPYFKITECTQGRVQVIAVDLREDSPSFLKTTTIDLEKSNVENGGTVLVVPPGCAHAYITLTPDAEYQYIQTGKWTKEIEVGISLLDPSVLPNLAPEFNVEFLSAKDKTDNFFLEELFPNFK